MSKQEAIHLYYSGGEADNGILPAVDFAETLTAIHKLANQAYLVNVGKIDRGTNPVSVKVNSNLKHQSFGFEVIVDFISSQVNLEDISLHEVVTWMWGTFGIMDLIRIFGDKIFDYLNRNKPNNDGSVTIIITNVNVAKEVIENFNWETNEPLTNDIKIDHEVVNLLNNPEVQKYLENIARPVSEKRCNEFGIFRPDKKEKVPIITDKHGNFKKVEEETTTNRERQIRLRVVSIHFEDPDKRWDFAYPGEPKSFKARVKDEGFITKVANRKKGFYANTTITVDLEIEISIKSKKTTRTIIHVYDDGGEDNEKSNQLLL